MCFLQFLSNTHLIDSGDSGEYGDSGESCESGNSCETDSRIWTKAITAVSEWHEPEGMYAYTLTLKRSIVDKRSDWVGFGWVWWVRKGDYWVVGGSVDSGCHKLSENIWFVWSKTYYEGERVRCHACGRMDKHVKVGQLGRIGNIIANRAPLNNSCNSTKLIQPWQFHWGQFLNLTTLGRCTNVHILGWDVWLKVFCNTKPPSSVIFVGTQCFSQVSWCGASGVWR